MAENQVQSEKKMTSLNVSSETRDAIKGISTSLGLSQADTSPAWSMATTLTPLLA